MSGSVEPVVQIPELFLHGAFLLAQLVQLLHLDVVGLGTYKSPACCDPDLSLDPAHELLTTLAVVGVPENAPLDLPRHDLENGGLLPDVVELPAAGVYVRLQTCHPPFQSHG